MNRQCGIGLTTMDARNRRLIIAEVQSPHSFAIGPNITNALGLRLSHHGVQSLSVVQLHR